jgi:hypothetical protein
MIMLYDVIEAPLTLQTHSSSSLYIIHNMYQHLLLWLGVIFKDATATSHRLMAGWGLAPGMANF